MTFKNVRILSPMAMGNGAFIVHSMLEQHIPCYNLSGYNPYWSLFPFTLPFLMRSKSADLIHSAPDYAIFHSTESVPLVITFHNYVLDHWMHQYSSKLQRIHYSTDLRLWTRLAVIKASAISAVSQFTASKVKQDLRLSNNISVIYNGVDENYFTPRHKFTSLNKKIKVFFSGNLTQRKGAHWLPAIAMRLNNNIGILYTTGLRTKDPFLKIDNLKSIGCVPYNKMPNQYRDMDILLMPSVREGFGLAIAEAMACGLPIVASSCSAIPELVDDGLGGFLCPVGDVDCFAEKINILADSPNLRKEMGQYNRSKVEKHFTVKRMVEGYRKLFDRILV